MLSFLIFFGAIGTLLYVFVRVFRSRVQRRMDSLEMPAELVAAQHAARATAALPGRTGVAPARAPAGVIDKDLRPPALAQGASHFMLVYDVGADFMQRRAEFRDEHLALAWKAAEAGELMLAGALEESAGQAFLLFRGTREAALRFAAADPYVKHGLVKGFRVRQWLTTVGAGAAQPTRPGGAAAQR
jgi:uncharacterized protein